MDLNLIHYIKMNLWFIVGPNIKYMPKSIWEESRENLYHLDLYGHFISTITKLRYKLDKLGHF